VAENMQGFVTNTGLMFSTHLRSESVFLTVFSVTYLRSSPHQAIRLLNKVGDIRVVNLIHRISGTSAKVRRKLSFSFQQPNLRAVSLKLDRSECFGNVRVALYTFELLLNAGLCNN
jgi:hypothetical protein